MPFGQSPWETAAAGMGNVGNSMARIAMAQQVGRMRAQQFAAQLALKQQQEQIQQQRLGLDRQETEARVPLINAQTDEARARAGEVQTSQSKTQQEIDRQSKMDELARAVAVNMYQQRVPGGVQGAMLRGGGPTEDAASEMNQGDLVRNAIQLMGMKDPNGITTMMMGKNIPQGDVNFNPLTGDRVEGLPPRPAPGGPIDETTGLNAYQTQQLILQRARLANEQDRNNLEWVKLKSTPDYMMAHPDEANSGGTGGKKKPSRAQAAEYVKKFGSPDAAKKQLQNDGFDTSGYAD